MQTQAQTNKTKNQSRQNQSTTVTEKVNNINGGMPNRISMNVTVPKQTQGATFGEKMQAGLATAKKTPEQEASLRGIITGSVTWDLATAKRTIKGSSVGNLAGGAGGGATAASYASTGMVINPSTQGVVSTIFVREAGSGMATGKRQYQPVFFEGQENVCTDCIAKVSTNPYFKENANAGEMPSLEKNKLAKGVDEDCDGVTGLTVSLVNEQTGAVVASVKTERCGDFFFENLPKASYVVKFSGEFIPKKSYDIAFDKEGTYDVAGELLSANNQWTIKINTGLTENPNGGEKVNAGLHAAGSAISQGASLLGGALPGGAVISAAVSSYSPGEPIPGIDVKLGKASTELDITSKTNEKGQFEFTGLTDGYYTLTSTLHFYIDSSIPVTIWLSKKGYEYYKAQSDLNKTSVETPIIETQENGTKNIENAKGKKGLNAVNVKMSKANAEKINPTAIAAATASTQDFKKLINDLEKLLNEDKRQYSIITPQINNVRNRINELESSLKNLGLLGRTAETISDLDAKLNLVNTDVSVLLENLGQLGNDYSSISNVLKTKHDTAKNSVGNIR
ncbi:MAG: hypothetical protein A3F91_12495 [Flavobacteria bacterium RIFCSPLOWO2_12_FULL_35_11]|nr:MAG: hypothetical protein A3F91_12495 [Flavobacteria bacterium RIFCSPLOWO2_12_FULL_35_11]